jgi:uncharacterized protein YndB with AHSA1/START domain
MSRGTYSEDDGRPCLRFERTFSQSIARVWAAITDPTDLRHWFPAAVAIELRVGGAVLFSEDPYRPDSTGTVLSYQPPTALAYTWGADELHFTLAAEGAESCRLTFLDFLAARDEAARSAAGWTICIGELDKLMRGAPGDGPHSDSAPPFEPIYESYIADGLPFGASIPP